VEALIGFMAATAQAQATKAAQRAGIEHATANSDAPNVFRKKIAECEAFPPSLGARSALRLPRSPPVLERHVRRWPKSRQSNVIKAVSSAALHKWHSDRSGVERADPNVLPYLDGGDYLSGDQIPGADLRTVWSGHAHCHHRSPAKEIRTAEGYFRSMPTLRMHPR
jgi:hypothetical protein